MTSDASVLAVWGYSLAGIGFLAFLLQLWRMGNARPPLSLNAASLLSALLFSTVWAAFGLADEYSNDTVFGAVAAVCDVARYASWFMWLLSSLGHAGTGRLDRIGGKLLVPVAGAVTLVGLAARWSAALRFDWATDSRLTWFGAMAMPVMGLVLLEQLYRNVHEDSRWNAKPILLGLAGTFLFDLYLFSQAVLFGGVDESALRIRPAVHAMMIPLLWLSFGRRSDWVAKLRVSRTAAFHSATLLIAGVYLLFVSVIGYYVRFFGGDWGRALELVLVVAALAALGVVGFSGAVRAKLRVLLGKHFFKYRYDYREEWLRFTQALSGQNSPQDMGRQIVKGLADMLESPAGSLWTRSIGGRSFHNTASWNLPAAPEVEPIDAPLCEFLIKSGWVINLAQYRSAPLVYGELALPGWLMATPRAWLVVPLKVADELTGFVVLASPRTAMDVNWEVNDLLKTAGRQAASFLSQMQATEALLEVRKFDAFNRMSAFVVHDLKNIVTQLSLMMKNAKRLQSNPEFQQDMLMTVENSLDRMRQLMMQLREGENPAGTVFGVDLAAALGRIEVLVVGKGRKLELQAPERVTARGDAERLERVVGHMVQNALDATDTDGTVTVRLDRHAGKARIEVIDTGIGMSKEFINERLFKPFQTTKAAGMGIGAYESHQYVQELGGSIKVQSEPGEGTRVVILLPLFEAAVEPDLHMLKAS